MKKNDEEKLVKLYEGVIKEEFKGRPTTTEEKEEQLRKDNDIPDKRKGKNLHQYAYDSNDADAVMAEIEDAGNLEVGSSDRLGRVGGGETPHTHKLEISDYLFDAYGDELLSIDWAGMVDDDSEGEVIVDVRIAGGGKVEERIPYEDLGISAY